MTRFFPCLLLLLAACCVMAAEGNYVLGLLSAARAGQTVVLPAGEFRGGVTVPAGVSVRGAGYARTVLDATGVDNGLVVNGGSGSSVSDLSVRGATLANVLITDVDHLTMRRLRASGGLIGVSVQGGHDVRVENVVSDGNRYGMIVSGGVGHTVVNCMAIGNASLGLSFPSGEGTVAFNNVVTDSSVDVNVGEVRGLALDYNLYQGLNIGKISKLPAVRESLNDWQYVSDLDQHSLSLPVKFENPAMGRFAAINPLPWALDRMVTAGWGSASLAGRAAPREDIDGVKQPKTPALGAYVTNATAPRPADGAFTVPAGKGLVSAGVFDADGKLITYFFHNLPLPAGKYPCWLPARSYTGQPIGAGTYEVRVVKGDLTWKYVGWFGNTGRKEAGGYGAPCSHTGLAFDNEGRLFVGNVASDVIKHIRCADASGQWLWTSGSCAPLPGPGLSVASNGLLYALRNMPGQGMCLTRFQPATGKVADTNSIELKDGAAYTGFAALGDHTCYTDTQHDAVLFGTLEKPDPTVIVTVHAPANPAADAQTGVLWVISGGEKLVAVSPEGKVIAEAQPVPSPLALAARDGVLAVASLKTGKVHLFDATNPAMLKPLRTIGTGDGPDGRILPQRFIFQDNPSMCSTDLALGPHGEVAVADFFRLQVFAPDNTVKWGAWGIWGGGCVPSHVTPGRVYGGFGFTYMLDGEKGSWQPESYHRALVGNVLADCRIGGQIFVTMWGPGWKETFVRFTPERAAQVLALEQGKDRQFVWRRDTKGNGLIDETDSATPLSDAAGKPVDNPDIFHHMYNALLPDGAIISAQRGGPKSWLLCWPCAGLDAQGVPVYKWEDHTGLPGADKVISPYTWKPDTQGIGQFESRAGGGWLMCTNLSSSPSAGKSPFNNGGSDVIGVAPDGGVDWIRTFGNYLHIGGFAAGNGLCIAGMATTCDFHVMDRDGLGLPGFSTGSAWLDHPQATVSFVDNAGKLNVLVTDCTKSCNDWVRLDACDIRRATTPLTLPPPTAELLAGLLAAPVDVRAGKPPTTVIHIPHLKAPLPIDGSPQKWRGITPQLIITPELGAVNISSPRECSVIFRYAWEGHNLYMQALKFDKVVTMPRNAKDAPNWQDTIEMAVNSYLYGMKFNFTLTQDEGPVIYCDGGWRYHVHNLDPDHAPRVIKVLNATELPPELRLMEGLAGVDMSDLKIELFEAKLPIDALTYGPDFKDALWEVKPGQQCWLNYLIDDNDEPGAEAMRFISYPPGSGTFMPKENGVLAIFEE